MVDVSAHDGYSTERIYPHLISRNALLICEIYQPAFHGTSLFELIFQAPPSSFVNIVMLHYYVDTGICVHVLFL